MKIEIVSQDSLQRCDVLAKKRLSELKQRCRVLVLAGWSIDNTAKRLNTSKSIVNDAIKHLPQRFAELGYKDEPYESEEYLINGYVAPLYQHLSKSEQKIFNTLL